MDFSDTWEQTSVALGEEGTERRDGVSDMGVWLASGVVTTEETREGKVFSFSWQWQGGDGHESSHGFGEFKEHLKYPSKVDSCLNRFRAQR